MEILAKIRKRINRKTLQKANFSIDQMIEQEPFLLYLGNGADGICYRKIFERRGIEGKELSYGPHSTIYMAYQKAGQGAGCVAVNGFTCTHAEFAGFWARRKEEGRWLWYTEAGWQPCAGEMAAKRLFADGDDIGELLNGGVSFLVLQAQWRESATGKAIWDGYPMYSNALMAHAFGAFEGHTYCNTMAAYENAVRNGYRYFEVDFSYTDDCRLVLCHGWEEKNCKCIGVPYSEEFAHMKYEQAMQLKVHGHEMMDARQFYQAMRDRPDDVYQIDLHNVHGKKLRKRIHSLLEDFSYDSKALDRLLIQVMNERMYLQTDQIYHFKHYQYLVGDKIHNLEKILNFCLDHGICAVALRANFATPETIHKIHNAGLYAMCYTIKKDADFAKYLLDMGVDTLCTDYVTGEQLAAAKDSYGMKPYFAAYLPAEDVEESEGKPFPCQNDGMDLARENRYEKEGFVFAGWNFRLKIDGTKYWYCTDGLYHGNIDFNGKTDAQKYLFREGEALPQMIVKEGMTVGMIAVWNEM